MERISRGDDRLGGEGIVMKLAIENSWHHATIIPQWCLQAVTRPLCRSATRKRSLIVAHDLHLDARWSAVSGVPVPQ